MGNSRLVLLVIMITVLCGCSRFTRDIYVQMSPGQVQFVEQMEDDYEKLLGKTKEEVLFELGPPANKERYTLNAVTRDRYTYYLIKPYSGNEKKILEVYFIDDKVSGFNLFADDQYKKDRIAPLIDQFQFGGL